MADIATDAMETSPFIAELESKNLHPLWDRYQRITPIKPQPPDAPFIVIPARRSASPRAQKAR